jgi:predicted enzyme related to lactoylglutathione lyase
MTDADFPAPASGFVVTHFRVVSDQDRSRDFYASVFGAKVVAERVPSSSPSPRTTGARSAPISATRTVT